ncbi:MAG: 5-formyltetrahydrofolate cyclo-ligase [Selenomonadaceae bacterium]|nr:5-formyltetrahydrofolate cyclo-ligase [Selenomonadaceae bacterium]
MTVKEEKKTLREEIRAKRKAIPTEVRARLSEKITAKLTCESFFRTEEVTFLYASIPEEVQLYGFMKFMLDIGRKIAVPYISKDGEMFAAEVKSIADLTFDKYGILTVTKEKRHIVLPEALGLIITPGVAFTEKGERLGMGGGYYDDFLRKNEPPACRVALAFDLQILDKIPTEERDEKVDFIVTESRTIAVRR